MSYLVSDLLNDLTGTGVGTSTDDIVNLNELIFRGARQLLADIDPPETERIVELQNGIYDDVFRYSAPSDLKGDRIIDIRPQVSRVESDNFFGRRSLEFDRTKRWQQEFSIEHDDGTKYLRIAKQSNRGILLNECETLTANGTWSVAGGATSLTSDTIYFVSGAGSLKFDLGATGGYVENSTMTAVDLTTHSLTSSVFVWIYLPTSASTTALTGVSLRFGSSSSAYYTQSVTSNFDSTAFHVGWNLLRFDWNTATATGSPTITAYNYLRLTLTTTATVTGVRVDSFYSRLPSIYEIVYYSKFLFRDSGGTFYETLQDATSIINLDTDSYNLLVNVCNLLAAQQRGGKDASFNISFFQNAYNEGLRQYKTRYPSQILPITNTYYRIP